MAEFLFITDSELKATTLMGGNVDVDKYKFSLSTAQDEVILPMLGTELYDVIYAGAEAETLTGLYLTLYNEYVKPITKYAGLGEYLLIASYTLDNAGLFIRTPDNTQTVEKSEAEFLSSKYMNKAQNWVNRFKDWIAVNEISEYTAENEGEVKAQDIETKTGWYFG